MMVDELGFVQGVPFRPQGYQYFRAKNAGGRQYNFTYPGGRSDCYNHKVEDYNANKNTMPQGQAGFPIKLAQQQPQQNSAP